MKQQSQAEKTESSSKATVIGKSAKVQFYKMSEGAKWEKLVKVVVWRFRSRAESKRRKKAKRLSLQCQYKCVLERPSKEFSSTCMVEVMTAAGATLGQKPTSPTGTAQTPA